MPKNIHKSPTTTATAPKFNPYADMKRQRDELETQLAKADADLSGLRARYNDEMRRAEAYQQKHAQAVSAMLKIRDIAIHGLTAFPSFIFGGNAIARKVSQTVAIYNNEADRITAAWLNNTNDQPGDIAGLETRKAVGQINGQKV